LESEDYGGKDLWLDDLTPLSGRSDPMLRRVESGTPVTAVLMSVRRSQYRLSWLSIQIYG